MDNLGRELLDFLATAPLREARNELYNLLEAGNDEVNVYYFVPLFNLKSIIADRGIKCRAMMDRDAVDLSGQGVQAKRNISLKLAQKVSSFVEIDKKIHECINFYWNPLNDTSYAFQRNALLLASLANSKVFYPKEELLRAEKELIRTIEYLQKLPIPLSVDKFCELINTFSNFKERLGCTLTEGYFINKNIAHSFHGISHITRVMFWVHILCYLTDTPWETEKAAQYAAFIHDLCRRDHRMEEEGHGLDAERQYEDFLRQRIPDTLMRSRCKNAVIYHCKEDSECPDKDLVWKILKDADSLNRGRFGHPLQWRSGIIRESRGCDIEYLRLEIFRSSPDLARELAWLAYRVASITHHTKWLENTFVDLKKEVVRSLDALLRNDILDQGKRQVANKMLGHLDAN